MHIRKKAPSPVWAMSNAEKDGAYFRKDTVCLDVYPLCQKSLLLS